MRLEIQQIAPDGKEGTLGLIAALGGIATVIANPVAGHLSDRTTSRYGMRRPWILGGTLLGLVGLLLTAPATTVAVVAIGWPITMVDYQAMVAGLTATVVDQFPLERRVRVAGVFSMCNVVGVVPAMVLAQVLKDSLLTQFAVGGVLAVAAGAMLCVVLPDRMLDPAEPAAISVRGLVVALLVLPKGARDYW